MKAKPNSQPPLGAKAWREIDELHGRMMEALYRREDRRAAAKMAPRLRALLARHDPSCETILGAAARVLLAELDGDFWSAIRAREREIELLRLLIDDELPPEVRTRPADIGDRLDLLAGLYWDSEDLDRAEEILLESQRWCAEHKVKFDGRAMLNELRKEMRSRAKAKRAPTRRAS
ncbi:MAG: hypothetical protein L0211_19370 [Planctomycetaceae bacterium]|nr:hypothetical protein [Planctomycetaceae bacterium]